MPVTLEPIVWIVRGGKDHHKFGDPYEAAVTAVKIDEITVRVAGLAGGISTQIYRDYEAAFDAMGFTVRERTRHRS